MRRLACVIIAILCVGCGGGGGTSGTTVGVPVFSPSPGTYATAQSVTLSTSTPGATIRYTTDGSTPSETVGTMYAGAIAVASSVTIRAVAYLSGWTTSSVSSGAYTITEPKVNVTVGNREVVFDWTTDRCEDFDLPDGPARFVRAADGELVLFSGNAPRSTTSAAAAILARSSACATSRRSSPRTRARPSRTRTGSGCGRCIARATAGTRSYTTSFTTTPPPPASAPSLGNLCWYNSVTYAVSSDGGRTFTKPNAPAHVVAPAPNAWVPPPVYPSEGMRGGVLRTLEHRPRARRVLLLADVLDPGQVEHVREGNLRDPQRSAGRSDELASVGRQRLQPPPDQPVRNGCIGHRLHVPAELDRQREPQLQHLPRPLHARGRLEHGSEASPAGSTSRCRPTWCTGARSR